MVFHNPSTKRHHGHLCLLNKGLLKNYRPANGKRFLVLCGPMCEIGPSAETTTTSWLTGETPSPALQTRGCNFATLVCHRVSRSVFIHYVKALHWLDFCFDVKLRHLVKYQGTGTHLVFQYVFGGFGGQIVEVWLVYFCLSLSFKTLIPVWVLYWFYLFIWCMPHPRALSCSSPSFYVL